MSAGFTSTRAGRHKYSIVVLCAALFFAGGGFHIYLATLPLYFESLGYPPASIGLLMSVAAAAELGAGFFLGPAVDRFGARLILLVGITCYAAAALGYWLATVVPALMLIRMLQGAGMAAIVPSGFSYVPALVSARRQVMAFSFLGVAATSAMAIFPSVGFALYEGPGPRALFTAAGSLSLVGLALAARIPPPAASRRPYALTFRLEWLPPVLINMAVLTQWGVITAFFPLVARAQGANPALLFLVDGVTLLVIRLPAGWLADRFGALPLVLAGLVLTIVSDALLLLPMTDPLVVLAGISNGVGGAMILPPLLAELSRRSDARTRGTALSYFSISIALGLMAGSGGGGLLYQVLGFQGLLIGGAGLCAVVMLVALADPLLRRPGSKRDRQ